MVDTPDTQGLVHLAAQFGRDGEEYAPESEDGECAQHGAGFIMRLRPGEAALKWDCAGTDIRDSPRGGESGVQKPGGHLGGWAMLTVHGKIQFAHHGVG